MPPLSPFRLLTVHSGLFGLSSAMAGGFIGAFLLKLGMGLPTALATYAVLLVLRFGLRFLALRIVRRAGLRAALRLGATSAAAGFLPLAMAAEPAWLAAWVLTLSFAEALYWPAYHASTAALATGAGTLGRQVAERTTIAAAVSVIGPLAGGVLLATFGEATAFGIAALVCLLSVLPLGGLEAIGAGPIPAMRDSLRGDPHSMVIFAAEGWIAAGLAYAWPMLLFLSLGASYETLGAANAAAGLLAAVASTLCGRAVDRGQRERYLALVCAALFAAILLRAASGWSPLAALLANASGAAIAGFYGPVVMSAVYERSKRSGAPYRQQLAAEAAWDAGAVAGLIAAALAAWAAPAPSLAMLPAAPGVAVLWVAVRGMSGRPAGWSRPRAGVLTVS